MKKNTKTILIIGGVLIGAGLIYYFFFRSKDEVPAPTGSTFEPYVPAEEKKEGSKGVEFVPADEAVKIAPSIPSTPSVPSGLSTTSLSSDLLSKATAASGSTLTRGTSTGTILPSKPSVSSSFKTVRSGLIK